MALAALGGLFGGGSSRSSGQQTPTSFRTSTPSFRLSSFSEGDGFFTSLERRGPVNEAFASRFPRSLEDIDTLRGTITPGFSDIREVRRQDIENARSRAVGNLRDTFARRRLSGSNFAADQFIRAEREFGEAQAQAQAQSFLEELDANLRVLDFEGRTIGAALDRELTEFGIASGVNVQLADLVSRNVQFEQQLAAQEAAARGSFFGQLLGLGTSVGIAALTGNPFAAAAGGAAVTSAAPSTPSTANRTGSIGTVQNPFAFNFAGLG